MGCSRWEEGSPGTVQAREVGIEQGRGPGGGGGGGGRGGAQAQSFVLQ